MIKYSIIAAVSNNNVIGFDNKLLWYLPYDLKFFKDKTIGHHIIMGRKTFESIGNGKPLKNRSSIVITTKPNYKVEGCLIANSIEDSMKLVKNDSEVFFIGGGQIYSQVIDIVDTIYLTRVDCNVIGDTYFPNINMEDWKLVNYDYKSSDENNKYNMIFETYNKIIK